MPRPTRRELLQALGLGAGAVACNAPEWEPAPGRSPDPTSDWEAEAADPDAFPLGCMAGDPLVDALILWTRYAGDAALTVHWALWQGESWVEAGEEPVTPGEGGFTHYDLGGLPPDQPVAFQFVDASGAASPVGAGRTAPAADAAGVVRVLAVCCLHQNHEDFPVLDRGLERGPVDLVAWLGDTVYTDGADTREQFRAIWRRNYTSPAFRRALPATTHVFTWDDHEVGNNWNPETIDPAQLATAAATFFEHTPIRRDPGHPDRIWRRFPYGATVDLFVLDCRGERAPSEGRYLSPAQMDWLLAGLAESKATWKLVFNSVPITDLPPPFDLPRVLEDRWAGYPEDRARLLDFIAAQDIRGLLFLSGDYHMPTVARVAPEGPHRRVFELLTGPGGSPLNPLGIVLRDQFPDQFPWAASTWTSTRLELDPNGHARVTFLDEAGVALYDALIDVHGHLLWEETAEQEEGSGR